MSHFDPVAANYDAYRPEYPAELYDTIEGYAGPLVDQRVLDLAAGTGIATRALTARGADVVASDLGEEMVRVLRHRSPSAPAVVARGEALPFRAACFDLITCATAWHWIDPDRSAAEAMRLLRSGGVLAVWWAFGGMAGSEDEEVAAREREVYARWQVGERGPIVNAANQTDPSEELPRHGFIDAALHQFAVERVVSVDAHVSHLLTHSPVFALGDDVAGLRADLTHIYDGRESVTEQLWCHVTLARRP